MWNERVTKSFLMVYVGCLFLATFFIVPTITSFYYYAWGKHLAWSYFDGPPMIAYFFYISHALFGYTFFSINIIGFICLIAGAYFIYKTGWLLRNQQTGLVSALIWMVLPTTTESIFIRVLYDAPLNLFTIVSFYYFARYILFKRVIDLYLSAFFIGAMILSKYTAVVSVASLLLYVVFSKERVVFKSLHFYLASALLILMVSPVLFWNINHHWVSITYLLNFHSQVQGHFPVIHSFLNFLIALGVNYSIFLALIVGVGLKYKNNASLEPNPVLELSYWILLGGVFFWLVAILLGGSARAVYLAPLGMNIALISGYGITQFDYNRFFKIVYPLFLFFSLTMISINAWPLATYLKKSSAYAVIRDAVSQPHLIKKGQAVVTGYYTNAAALSFFMPNEVVYTIPCGDINQYRYWSDVFLNDLVKGKIDKISYIDFKDTKQCAERFFKKCHMLALLSHQNKIPVIHKRTKPVSLYVYECSLPRMHSLISVAT